jgi:Tol biopolymer transport system component
MTKTLLHWVAVMAVAAAVAFGRPVQSGHDLFQQALVKERAEGDLQEAIDLYDRIVRDFPEDHALAAKALVQMGQCYEKLGKAEARKAYERVIRDYADQAEPLQVARARLAALTHPPHSDMTVRRLWTDPMADTLGEVSPDGRHLSFVDWKTGNLAVRDLSMGESRALTKSSWKEWLVRLVNEDVILEFPLFSRWSPDGTQIAYDWWSTSPSNELRIVELSDARSRVLHEPDQESSVVTVDWSPDGREILVLLWSESTARARLATVSVADGAVRTLRETDGRDPWDPVGFSPDGRYILYSAPSRPGGPGGDVFVLTADGQGRRRLVDHPANDMAAGWSPDGRWVLFVSDRTGTLDLWGLPVDDGRPAGDPRLVKAGIDRITPAGFDGSGRFYYATGRQPVDVFTAQIDPRSGRVLSPPTRAIRRFEGSNDWPAYSRDGSQLAYVSARGSLTAIRPRFNVVCVRSLATGEERAFHTGFRRLAGPSFSADGRAVFVAAFGEGDRAGVYRVDASTGEFSPVVEVGEGSSLWAHAVSPDGKALFYARCDDAEEACRILRRDLASGAETMIYRGPEDEAPTLAVAPDGRSVAFITRPRKPANAERVVRVVPSSGGTPREIYRFRHLGLDWITLEFSADGRDLLLPRKTSSPGEEVWTLVRLPVEGGEPRDLGLTMEDFVKVTAHPDGEQIAFSSKGIEHKDAELWVIEDFLPVAGTQD